jgi:hypothetical protein
MYRRLVRLVHASGLFLYAFELVVRVTSLGEGKKDMRDHDTINLGYFSDNYKIKSYGHTYAWSRTNDADISNVVHVGGPGELSRYSDSLRVGLCGDRIPVGVRFSAPVQTDPGAHPPSCTMGTGPFPGVKRPERGVGHPPNLSPRLS